MDNLILSGKEHKLLKKHKKSLENRFNVKIQMPDFDGSSPRSDMIFVRVCGNANSISSVQSFLKQKDEVMKKAEAEKSDFNAVPVITLSDSDEDENIIPLTAENNVVKNKKKRKKKQKATNERTNQQNMVTEVDLTSSGIQDGDMCSVSSTTDEPDLKRNRHELPEAADFIPLTTENNQKGTNGEAKLSDHDDSVVILEQPAIERPVPRDPKLLRPIVIDGSNVAREHGKVSNTFSCKGIQLSVEHFLKRGHTRVTAFVPHYRRYCSFGPVPTTDQPLLEELAKSQHVVFTPSRKVQGKRVTCYDDRFIVDLATMTDGVILSNDNYKDLIDVSDKFKKTIEERLLMFCFVGDILMIPNDPLGRNGPSLDDFLSFPSTE